MPPIHVATRKGLFLIDHSAARRCPWDIAALDFLAAPVSISLVDPRTRFFYAALNHGHFGVKLHRSMDAGQTWQEISVPRYPDGAVVPQRMADGNGEAGIGGPPTKPASLSEIWSLEPGGADEPGVLWAGTIPGGLFRSDDNGDSWHLVDGLWNRPERMQWFGGGKDDAGIHSICVDPRDSRHVSVAISCGGVWVTRDGGDNWECRGDGLRAEYMPPELAGDPNIQDAHRMVACPSAPDHLWIQHHNGIFRSTDDCSSWQEIDGVQPSSFGFAVAVHPRDPNTAWFVPARKDEYRVPVDARLVVTQTVDGGQSFLQHSQGLPQQNAYDIVYRHALDVDASGDLLAMGSTTGNFWISEDGGQSWQCVSGNLPPIYAVRFLPRSA